MITLLVSRASSFTTRYNQSINLSIYLYLKQIHKTKLVCLHVCQLRIFGSQSRGQVTHVINLINLFYLSKYGLQCLSLDHQSRGHITHVINLINLFYREVEPILFIEPQGEVAKSRVYREGWDRIWVCRGRRVWEWEEYLAQIWPDLGMQVWPRVWEYGNMGGIFMR